MKRTAPEIAAQYERSKLAEGDLLVAIRGTLGRVAVVPPELNHANVSRDVARLALSERLDVEYVSVCLRSPLLQRYFARVARGVAVQGVNIGNLRPAPVLLAPADEQAAILSEVDRILSVVEEVDAETQLDLRRASRLRQSILKQAFEGKLVPQDPSDEPAEVLLSRLAADRGQGQRRGGMG